MEQKIKSAKSFIDKHGIGRDTFIYILNAFENSDGINSIVVTYKNNNIQIVREEWMSDVQNKRKLYEDAMSLKLEEVKEEVIKDNVEVEDLAVLRTIQTLRDKNVQLNKIIRENFRKINKSEGILSEIKEAVKGLDVNFSSRKRFPISDFTRMEMDAPVGILQLSDLHANEIIDEPRNKFDFEVLSKRLKHFVKTSISFFNDNNVSKVYMLGTGDFINSNRRPSEKLNSATSRVRASFIVVKLIASVINELYQEGFDIAVACVSSNESRIEQVLELDDISASENFDILIYYMLKLLLEENDIEFIDCDTVEGVINVKEFNRNILITHGVQYGATDLQRKVQQTKGKFASQGILIDHVFSGNIHSAYISDTQSRSGSACGGNGFSDSELNFDSRASQNCYLYRSNGSVDGLKIDLQDVHNDGFDIENELKKYHVKRIVR